MSADKKPAAETKKKPKAKKKGEAEIQAKPSLSFKDGFLAVLLSPFSPDRWTMMMGLLFYLSLLGLALTPVVYKQCSKDTSPINQVEEEFRQRIKERGEEVVEESGEHNLKIYNKKLGDLGTFFVETKPAKGKGFTSIGNVAMAEIHIAVLCDGPDKEATITCDYIRENMTQARDAVTSVLLPIEREILLSVEGKKQLKRDIIEKLNEWLRSGRRKVGKVREAYFYHLAAT